MGSSDGGRGEADRQWVSEVERAEGEMDLRFLKVMVRFCFVVGMGMSMSMDSQVVRDMQVVAG